MTDNTEICGLTIHPTLGETLESLAKAANDPAHPERHVRVEIEPQGDTFEARVMVAEDSEDYCIRFAPTGTQRWPSGQAPMISRIAILQHALFKRMAEVLDVVANDMAMLTVRAAEAAVAEMLGASRAAAAHYIRTLKEAEPPLWFRVGSGNREAPLSISHLVNVVLAFVGGPPVEGPANVALLRGLQLTDAYEGPIKLAWKGEEPSAEIVDAIMSDIRSSLLGLDEPSDLGFHHVLLTGDDEGPGVFVHGKKGSDAFYCEYLEAGEGA